MPGTSLRTASTCHGRKRPWTEQCPFQRMSRARRSCSGVLPPSSTFGSHSAISSKGMPNLTPVLRPRCWSGKKKSLSASFRYLSKSGTAFDEVQTTPPCSPQKALIDAEEFM